MHKIEEEMERKQKVLKNFRMHCKRVKICETRGSKISSKYPSNTQNSRVKFGSKTSLCTARKNNNIIAVTLTGPI